MEKAYRHKAAKPLLSSGRIKSGHLYLHQEPGFSPLDTEDGPLYQMKGKRRTSMIGLDAAILILEFLQILALMQSMSLKWVWPSTWLTYTNYILFFNLDVWDFVKVSSGVFRGVQNYDIPSSLLPYSFNYMVLGWSILLILVCASFALAYGILHHRRRPYLLVHTAKMERAIVIICQILALPIGTVIFKLFHCTGKGAVDVLNDLTCFSGTHWVYVIFGVMIIIILFIVLTVRMVYLTRHEVLASTSKHHESYLQLKEMEYMSGLDVIWLVKGFHIFSSFRLRGVHYRAAMHLFKLLLLIIYSALYQHILAQAVTTAVILCLVWFLFIIIRPFRVMSFNVFFIIAFPCLIGDAVFGACIANVPPYEISSPWLVEPYSSWVMVSVNAFMIVLVLVFLIFLIISQYCCRGKRGKKPLWPAMSYQGADKMSVETNKFMTAVLRGRTILDKCRSVNPMFAPVHELSQQIQVINAYLREAEFLSDGLHDTLWDLLDEMILAHEKLEPKSLFGESVKDNIRGTASDLMKMMPMFSRRMAQRDYDLILVSPMKRRMLLKMFVMGVFLNGRSEKVAKQQITGPELDMIWPESSANPVYEDKHEYFEDLYPTPLCGPDQEQMYASESLHLPLDLLELDDEDEKSISSIIKGAPDFLTATPAGSRPGSSLSGNSRSGYVNPAFVSDKEPGLIEADGKQPGVTLEDFEQGETTVDNQQGETTVDNQPGETLETHAQLDIADASPKKELPDKETKSSKDGDKRKKNRDPSKKRRKSKSETRRKSDATPESTFTLQDVSKSDVEVSEHSKPITGRSGQSSEPSKPITGRSGLSSEHVTSEKEKSSEQISLYDQGDVDKTKRGKHKSLKKKRSHKK